MHTEGKLSDVTVTLGQSKEEDASYSVVGKSPAYLKSSHILLTSVKKMTALIHTNGLKKFCLPRVYFFF